MSVIKAVFCQDGAQGLAEYALVVALASLVTIGALNFLGFASSNSFADTANVASN